MKCARMINAINNGDASSRRCCRPRDTLLFCLIEIMKCLNAFINKMANYNCLLAMRVCGDSGGCQATSHPAYTCRK